MADSSTFKDRQYAFAAHIRDPHNVAAPEGIEDRRMAIYRKLFFNNLRSLLGTFFPVLRKIHSDEDWRRFIRGFMRHHEAQTPYFLKLPEEFLAYLQNEFEPSEQDFPFLVELAHYEYAELALSVSDDETDMKDVDPDGDLMQGVPVKSALAWAFAYQYPVHRISPDFLPGDDEAEPVYLALYRDIDNNPQQLSGEALLRKLAAKINYPDADALVEHGAAALREMRELEILLGARSPS